MEAWDLCLTNSFCIVQRNLLQFLIHLCNNILLIQVIYSHYLLNLSFSLLYFPTLGLGGGIFLKNKEKPFRPFETSWSIIIGQGKIIMIFFFLGGRGGGDLFLIIKMSQHCLMMLRRRNSIALQWRSVCTLLKMLFKMQMTYWMSLLPKLWE